MAIAAIAPRQVVRPSIDVRAHDLLRLALTDHEYTSHDDVRDAGRWAKRMLGTPLGQEVAAIAVDGSVRCDLKDGRTVTLQLAPGTVALRVSDAVRVNATREREVSRLRLEADAAAQDLEAGVERTAPPARVIKEWSRRSRARMVRAVAELDYSGWGIGDGTLAMVTLTLPGMWEVVAPSGAEFKRAIEIFKTRWERATGSAIKGLWKLEFQRRGAPHLHALLRVPALVNGLRFEQWLSQTWAGICADLAHEHATVEQWREYLGVHKVRHVLAGTGVDYSGVRFSDPRRIAIYFLKHSAKTLDDKEYQHQVPTLWREDGAGPGRFWGYWGLKRAVVGVDLRVEDFVPVARVLRKIARARLAVTQLQRRRALIAAGEDPGEWKSQRSRAPSSQFASRGRMTGGFVVVNDGLDLAYDLVRYIAQLREREPQLQS